MPMLVDERQMNTALQLAAQSPFEGVDPGFVERFKTDFTAMRDFSNSDAFARHREAAQGEFINQLYQQGDLEARQWVGGGGATMIRKGDEEAQKWFEQWKAKSPDRAGLTFPDAEALDKTAYSRMGDSRAASVSAQEKSSSTGSGVGGFLGTMAGAVTDPINAVSMFFGAPMAAGVLRTALTEAAIGMASESGIQALTFGDKKKIDPTYSASDAFSEIAAAGVGGAVLGGGIKGLAAAWSRAKTGQWPSHVRDTANVVNREAAVPNSRFEKSVSGEAAYQAGVSKSLDDLMASRPVELPPEAFTQANARPGRVYDADGNSVGVRYEVVDAKDLITSHGDDLTPNAAFPQELQPRDRSRALSQDQITGIAANLQPERLGFSTDAANGAPIVGPDGLVESGNGRVLALRRAYNQEGIPAENYRNYLRSQNFEIDGMQNPVLIARRVTDLEDRVGFVTAANRSTSMKLGATEQALSDARLIDGPLLDTLDGTDIKAAGNQQFSRGFMSKLPRAEQGSLVDKDGFLSQDGERRITAALMGRAYGEPVLLGRALEDTDSNVKGIAGAMADSSAPWARMRDAVSRGEIPAGMDITDDLMNAVRLVMKARDEGRAVKDMVNQAEMFGGPDELSKIVARAMFSDADLKRPVGRARLSALLSDYASEAMKNDAGPRLFDEPLASADILKSSLERVGRNDLMRVAEERLTPEAMDKLAEDPMAAEVAVMDAQRLRMAESEPAVPDGMTRVYHSGAAGEGETGRWVSTNKQYASDYRKDLPLYYLDVPVNDARVVNADIPEQGVKQGFTFNFETTPQEASRLKEIRRDGEKPAPIMIDIGDGLGERSLDDILDEADDEIAAAGEIEACAIGREKTE